MPDSVETLTFRVESLEKKMYDNREEHGKFYERLESVEKWQGIVQADLRNIQELCNEIKADVKELKEKPSKKYDSLMNSIVQWAAICWPANGTYPPAHTPKWQKAW